MKHVSQGPHIDAERRLIRKVLVLGTIGGLTTWAVTFAAAGVTGLYVLLAICVLVCAAWARAVGA
jgi:hypothetical protein